MLRIVVWFCKRQRGNVLSCRYDSREKLTGIQPKGEWQMIRSFLSSASGTCRGANQGRQVRVQGNPIAVRAPVHSRRKGRSRPTLLIPVLSPRTPVCCQRNVGVRMPIIPKNAIHVESSFRIGRYPIVPEDNVFPGVVGGQCQGELPGEQVVQEAQVADAA